MTEVAADTTAADTIEKDSNPAVCLHPALSSTLLGLANLPKSGLNLPVYKETRPNLLLTLIPCSYEMLAL